MDLNDMVLFARVAEQQGISAAARLLNMPKSRVSRRIAGLEETLGVRLLERTTRSIQLTEMGEIFLQHCKRISEEAENALNSLQHMMEVPRGRLRISVSVTMGQYLIAPHLSEFMKLYPEIDVELDLANRRVDLVTEGYDLAVRVGDLADSSMMSKRIGRARAQLCASPEYISEYGRPATPEDLAQHKTLVMSDSRNITSWLLEDSDGTLKTVETLPEVAINDFTALRKLTEDGCGIAIMPEYVIQDAKQQGRLVQVLPEWRSPAISYYVLYPSRQGLTKKARAWIDFFNAKLGKPSSD